MKSKLLAVSTALFFSLQSLSAQVSAYTFSQFPSSFGSIASPTAVGPQAQDDDVTSIPLPFTFTYNGTPYTSVNVCANGYISFAALSGNEYSAISDAGTSNVIAAFADDLLMTTYVTGDLTTGSNSITNCSSVAGFSVGDVIIDWNNDFGSNPTITNIVGNTIVVNLNSTSTTSPYDVLNFSSTLNETVIGTAPNRVYEIEFKKFSRFFVSDECLNFKFRLYETSNRIEIVYGACVAGSGFTSPEVGLKGNSSADYNNRKVVDGTNNWNTSVAGTNITDACDFTSSAFPVSGQVYQWLPVTCTVPVLAIAPSKTVSCANEVVNLTASGATTYTWMNGPATAQYTVAPVSTSIYTLIGANLTCTSTLVYTANVAATPSITITQPRATICAGQSTTLSASGASTYSWNGNAGNANYVFNGTAAATLIVAGSNGTCSATKSIVQGVNACTGISENEILSNAAISVFPNPFKNVLQIKNTSANELTVTLTDAIGAKVYEANLSSSQTLNFDSDNLRAGFYFLNAKGDGVYETKRLVKN